MRRHLVAIALALMALTACTSAATIESELKTQCVADGRSFMMMPELREGHVVGPSCAGCMVDEKTHVCDMDTYKRLRVP